MSATEQTPTFDKLWKDGGNYGAGLEDLARELYDKLSEKHVPREMVRVIVYLIRELKAMDDYFTETFAEIGDLNNRERNLRTLIAKHTHGATDGKALLPVENVEKTKET